MKNNLISVIIPVYRVEEYLDKCIESVINQTYKNLEIILVDDGSDDLCPEMCEKWSTLDSRIKVIHKPNGGLASARNAGLAIAAGDYIGFVDSDDYLDSVFYETMLCASLENEADMVEASLIREEKNKARIMEVGCGCMENSTAVKHLLLNDGHVYSNVFNKLYKRNVIANIRFDEELVYAEDTLFTFLAIVNCERFIHVCKAGYHYVQRENSLVSGGFSAKKMLSLTCAEKISAHCSKYYPDYYGLSLINQSLRAYYLIRALLGTENWKREYRMQLPVIIAYMNKTGFQDIRRACGIRRAAAWYCASHLTNLYELILRIKNVLLKCA